MYTSMWIQSVSLGIISHRSMTMFVGNADVIDQRCFRSVEDELVMEHAET